MNCCSCLWDLVTLSNGWIWWLSSTAYLTQIFVTCLWSLFLKWSRYKNVAVTFSFRLHLISDKPPRWSFWHFRGIRAKLCALSKWRSQAGGEAGSRVKTNLYDALVNLVLPTPKNLKKKVTFQSLSKHLLLVWHLNHYSCSKKAKNFDFFWANKFLSKENYRVGAPFPDPIFWEEGSADLGGHPPFTSADLPYCYSLCFLKKIVGWLPLSLLTPEPVEECSPPPSQPPAAIQACLLAVSKLSIFGALAFRVWPYMSMLENIRRIWFYIAAKESYRLVFLTVPPQFQC